MIDYIKLTTIEGYPVFLDYFGIKAVCGTCFGSDLYCLFGVFHVKEKPEEVLRLIAEPENQTEKPEPKSNDVPFDPRNLSIEQQFHLP